MKKYQFLCYSKINNSIENGYKIWIDNSENDNLHSQQMWTEVHIQKKTEKSTLKKQWNILHTHWTRI